MEPKRKSRTGTAAVPDVASPLPGTVPAFAFLPTVADAPIEGSLLPAGAALRREPGASTADPLGGSRVSDGVSDALRRRAGLGDPLPESLSDPLGRHFGQDFSAVRIHRDHEAGAIA